MRGLAIEGVCAWYGTAQVLWDVSLGVEPGEVVALIGANGAGKTTLMRSISGLIGKCTGSIALEEREMLGRSAADIVQAGLAQVPEGRRLFAGMTVQENLMMGAYLRMDKEQVARDLEQVFQYLPKLRERRKQMAGKLSGGEQQMCAIGRALMSDPKIMLIDELSLGLAPVVVDELLHIIAQLKADGMSILLVEQDVQTGLDISSRAYVLEHGRIALQGTSEELARNPQVRESYLGI